ncbi:hypothetical protein KC315_g4148 [Hortaea werneckii]|nr:hypothetical protein KC315_g4148 [Hortaea werneckii]
MQNIREKLKRKLSLHDKNPNLDEVEDPDDIDDHKQIEHAQDSDEPHGKPGSFLNKLIMHGNKRTEEQIAREQNEIRESALAKENQQPGTSS